MKYRLSKKKIGTNKVEVVNEFQTRNPILDICYIDDFGFVFSHGNSIGHLDFQDNINLDFITRLDSPTSLCYSKYHRTCYIFYNDGKGIMYFQHNMNITIPFLGSVYQSKLDTLYLKTKNVIIEGAVDFDDNLFVTSNKLHKCLRFSGSEFHNYAGIGTEGYSASDSIDYCMFSQPLGIAYYNKALYIADTGNHCIRKVDKSRTRAGIGTKVQLLAGSPLHNGDKDGLESLLESPRKIRVKNNIGIFIDNDKIKYLVLSNGDVKTMYKSNNSIISLELDSEKNAYILEAIL